MSNVLSGSNNYGHRPYCKGNKRKLSLQTVGGTETKPCESPTPFVSWLFF